MNKNSVLIISSEYDRSTFDVSKWLKHFGYECIYVNNLSSVVINIDNVSDNIVFTTSDKKYNLSMFNSIWYRRGEFKINSLNNSNKLFETYISFEDYVINKFIGCKIRQQKTLNNYEDNFINKLQLLERASCFDP